MNVENEPILIGQAGDIDINTVAHFEYDEIEFAIYHLESGFFATQGICMCEENALLSEGTIENEEIECGSCGEVFSIVAGDSISNPELNSLKIYDVTLEEDNILLNL